MTSYVYNRTWWEEPVEGVSLAAASARHLKLGSKSVRLNSEDSPPGISASLEAVRLHLAITWTYCRHVVEVVAYGLGTFCITGEPEVIRPRVAAVTIATG